MSQDTKLFDVANEADEPTLPLFAFTDGGRSITLFKARISTISGLSDNSSISSRYAPSLYHGSEYSAFLEKERARLDKKKRFSLRYVIMRNSKRLRKKTQFTQAETEALIHIFWKLTDRTMKMSYDQLLYFLHQTFNFICASSLKWRGYERHQSEMISLDEFLRMLGVILGGTTEDRGAFAFEICDLNGDGKISTEELNCLLEDVLITPPGKPKDYFEESKQQANDLVEQVLTMFGINRFEGITKENFIRIVKNNPLMEECFCPMWPEEKYVRLFKKMLFSKH